VSWIIGIILILAFFIVLGNSICNNEDKRRSEHYKSQGLVHIKTFVPKFLGGFNDVGACEICIVDLFKDKIVIKLSGGKGNNIFNKTKTIMIDNILGLKVQTESEIKEKVSLGKLVCFGVFAFGMDGNKKTTSNNYVVMKARCNDEEVNLVFQIDDYTDFMSSINQIRYNN